MAWENVVANAGSGGSRFAVEQVTIGADTVLFPACVLAVGADGGPFTIVSGSAGLPVAQQGTWNITNISGTVSLPTGAATLAEQQTQTTALSAIQTAVQTLDNAIAGNEMQVDVITMPTVTVDSELPAAAALADNTANPTTTSVGTFPHWFDGVTWDRAIGNAIDGLLVNLGTNNDVTVTGTVAATQSGTWNVTNISGTVSLPTGAATAANQATIIGHVDGLEGLLTTIDADTGALAACVAGTELQVDIVAMPAVDTELTTADLDTGAGTDMRAVVGLVGSASGGGQLIPGSATDGLLVNLGANNDVVVSGTVAATQSGTWNVTNVSGTVSLPTGASTLSEQQTQTTSLQLLDDIVATLGTTTYTETTTKGAVIGAVRKDAAGTLANTDNEIAPLQLNANGQLRVDASAVAVPATQSGTWNIGTVTTVTTVSAVTSITTAVTVVGNAAHDAAVSGNPVLNAAEARTSESAVSASGDVVRLMADLVGKLVTMPYAPTDLQWQGTGSKTDTTDLAIKAAAGAGIRNYITDLICANSSATNVTVIVKDGSTEIARLPVPANGGVVHRFSTPLKGTANTAINLASSASATTIYMTAAGFTGR